VRRPKAGRARPDTKGFGVEEIIDRVALGALVEDIGTDRAQTIVGSYLATLDERLYHLRAALAACDTERAIIALRGLGAASDLVGARELSRIVRQVEPALSRGSYGPARESLPELLLSAAATTGVLIAALSEPAESGTPRSARSR
jgi:HPt (histidine-containing phosphotransfer) domain-containing protein